MCMEDIRVGRRTRVTTKRVLVGATVVHLVQKSEDRIALILSTPLPTNAAPQTGRVTISTDRGVTDQAGVVLYSGNNPQCYDVQKHGALVTENIYAIADGAARSIGVIEVFLPEK